MALRGISSPDPSAHERTGLTLRLLVLLTLFLSSLVWPGPTSAEHPGVRPLTRAFIAVTDLDVPPSRGSPLWQPVTLTDRWPLERYQQGRLAWYRIPLELASVPAEPLGILLRRTNMNAAIHLNGERILSGGSFEEPLGRNWNRPLYAVPSLALWRQGSNDLYLRHVSHPGYGYVSTVFLGPDSILGPEYERLFLMQVRIAQYLFPVTVGLCLLALSIWLRLPAERIYLYFALAIGFWSVYIVNMFLRDLAIPTKLWEWIAHLSVDAWVISFVLFMHAFAGDSLKIRGWLYGVFLATAALTYALVDLATLKQVVPYFHGASILVGGWVAVGMMWRWWSTDRNVTLGILNVCLVVLLGTGVHDWMFQSGFVGVTGPVSLHLHYYGAPLVFAFITWHLASRFAATLADLSRLNAELESRVRAAELALAERYEQIGRMEKERAVLTERERLAREIHDGVGGSLANAIMLANIIDREAAPSRIGSLKTLLQDGLTDVRQLVTTMAGDLATLDSVIGYVGVKADNVLTAADVNLKSSSGGASEFRPLTQSESLNLVRIFQEAVNNVVKHADAATLSIDCQASQHAARITIEDDGVGFSGTGSGYGLANIRKRCAEIGAGCTIDSRERHGTRITIELGEVRTVSR